MLSLLYALVEYLADANDAKFIRFCNVSTSQVSANKQG